MDSVSPQSLPEIQARLDLLCRFRQSLQDFKEQLEVSTFKHGRANQEQSLEDTHSANLFSEIMGLLSSGNANDKRFLISQCMEILHDPTTEYGIDGCVLWSLLMRTIDKLRDIDVDDPEAAKYEEEDAKFRFFALDESKVWDNNIFSHQRNEVILVAMIVTVAPHLIFERLESTRSGGGEIGNNCSLREIHTGKSTYKSSPLQKAVQKGATAVIRCMLHHGGLFCQKELHLHPGDRRRIITDTLSKNEYQVNSSEDLMVAVLRRRESIPGSRNKLTLLEQAGNNGSLGALRTLLDFSPILAAPPDETFENAQKRWGDKDNSTYDIVESLLTYPKCREMFVTEKNIMKALDEIEAKVNLLELSHGQGKPYIAEENLRPVKLLLENVENSREVGYRVTRKIIELDLTEVWNENWKTLEHDKAGLLHLAVQYQKPRFVRMFLRKFPDSVTIDVPWPGNPENKETYYPLWHNNKRIKDLGRIVDREDDNTKWPFKEEIRRALVSATIRQVKIEKLPDIFHRSHQPVRELCFDLPHFNSKKYTISQFVDSLINHQENAELLSYEPTIRYAAFPVLDSNENRKETVEGPRREHTEVFNVLRWLQNSKQVTRIMELIVPDRLANPHNENKIAKYVKHFRVESLDWRFVDLSVSVFGKQVKDQLRVLHLYWSGKQAVLSHWLSIEGVWALPKLTKLYIHVVEGLMVQNTFYNTKARLETIFENAKKDMKTSQLKIDVSRDPWSSTHVVLGDLKEVAEKVVPKLAPFINSYRGYVNTNPKNHFRPTRVAIIDNGILSMLPGQGQEPYTLRSPRSRRSKRNPAKDGPMPDKKMINRPLLRTDSTSIDFDIFETNASDLSDPDLETEDEDEDVYKCGEYSSTSQSKGGERTLWSRIKEGRSFVRDCSRVSPWLFASHPHGTQMANLICALDPLCEIYVAKVTDGRHGITASRVAQAIEWAISRDVDIISMSFAILETNGQLKAACREAGTKQIIMLCSAHDEGYNLEEAWPAAHIDSWTITACDNYGKVLHETKQTYQYAIPGVDVRAGVVPFLDSNDRISGSSVATAIAAGLSSLILSCDAFVHPDMPPTVWENKRKERLEKHLKKMASHPKSKYIMLEKLCDLDRKTLNGDHITASKVVEEWFVYHDTE